MTEPRAKKAKEAGELSETAKTFVEETYLRKEWGYSEPIVTPEMLKGRFVEPYIIGIINDLLPSETTFRIANRELFKNEYFSAKPDIILTGERIIEDVKASWSIKTFFYSELVKSYWWQLQVYMNVLGYKKARLIYVLVDTPDHLLEQEKKRYYFKYECNEEDADLIDAYKKLDRTHIIENRIPIEQRIKIFEIEYDAIAIERLKEKVVKAREYYFRLTLNRMWGNQEE
jgi:hypothetical protein